MSVTTIAESSWNSAFPASSRVIGQSERIMEVFGRSSGGLPRVSERTLTRYYDYLEANLALPFTAYYPQPTSAEEKIQFSCSVVELLDPNVFLGDEFDGIYCKTHKGGLDVNLPLIELHVPENDPAFQWIEDYWFWFWNWR